MAEKTNEAPLEEKEKGEHPLIQNESETALKTASEVARTAVIESVETVLAFQHTVKETIYKICLPTDLVEEVDQKLGYTETAEKIQKRVEELAIEANQRIQAVMEEEETNEDTRTTKEKIAEFHKDQELSPERMESLQQAEDVLADTALWPAIKRLLLDQLKNGESLEELKGTIEIMGDKEAEAAAETYMKRRYEKRQALSELQVQAVDEEVNLGAGRVDLMEMVKEEPDRDSDELESHIEKLRNEGNLTEEQAQELERWVQIYEQKRQNIRDVRAEFPDNDKLLQHLYGLTSENARVIDGVVTLGFVIEDEEDFIKMHTGESINGREVSDVAVEQAKLSNGFLRDICLDQRMRRQTIVLNAQRLESPEQPTESSVYIHEQKHAFDAIDNEAFGEKVVWNPNLIDNLEELLPEKRRLNIRQYLRNLRVGVEMKSKEEVRAYKAEAMDNETVRDLLLSSREDEGYGFSQDAKEDEIKRTNRYLAKNEKGETNEELLALVREVADEVYDKEYKIIVNDSLQAYDKVTELLGGDRELADSVLADHPLRSWKKIAKRMDKTIFQKND